MHSFKTLTILLMFVLLVAFAAQGNAHRQGGGRDECPPNQNVTVGLEVLVANISSPIVLTFARPPGFDHEVMFVAEQTGEIIWFDANNNNFTANLFLNISDLLVPLDQSYDERGLLGLTFHPDFSTNGRFAIVYSAPAANPNNITNRPTCLLGDPFDHYDVVAEYQVSEEDPVPNRIRTIITTKHPFSNHNGANSLHYFGSWLLWGIGDGGLAYDPFEAAQNLSIVLGKILAFDTSLYGNSSFSCNTPVYTFDELKEACPQVWSSGLIWSYGNRNLAGFTFDFDENGTFLGIIQAEAGQSEQEEVNYMTRAGQNYGWDVLEGVLCVNQSMDFCPQQGSNDTANSFGISTVLPLAVKNHTEENSPAVFIGGEVYKGTALPCLNDAYVFGAYSLETEIGGEEVLQSGALYYLNLSMLTSHGGDVPVPGEVFDSEPAQFILNQCPANGSASAPSDTLLPVIDIGISCEFKEVTYFNQIATNTNHTELYILANTATGPVRGRGVIYKIVPPRPTQRTC